MYLINQHIFTFFRLRAVSLKAFKKYLIFQSIQGRDNRHHAKDTHGHHSH